MRTIEEALEALNEVAYGDLLNTVKEEIDSAETAEKTADFLASLNNAREALRALEDELSLVVRAVKGGR